MAFAEKHKKENTMDHSIKTNNDKTNQLSYTNKNPVCENWNSKFRTLDQFACNRYNPIKNKISKDEEENWRKTQYWITFKIEIWDLVRSLRWRNTNLVRRRVRAKTRKWFITVDLKLGEDNEACVCVCSFKTQQIIIKLFNHVLFNIYNKVDIFWLLVLIFNTLFIFNM